MANAFVNQANIRKILERLKTFYHSGLAGLTADDHTRYLDGRVNKCRVYNSGSLTIGTGAITYLTFNNDEFDLNDLHSTSSDTSRISLPVVGYWCYGACIKWEVDANEGTKILTIVENRGSELVKSRIVHHALAGAQIIQNVTSMSFFHTTTRYIEARVWQNSGGDLDIVKASEHSPYFWAFQIG